MRQQFGRLCRLEFTNLVTKKKFTIDQSLRITFEFFKSVDEGAASSTGTIVIHGLTQETAEKLGDRIGNNFQTEVKCSVGYAGDIKNFQTLFYGAVTKNQYKRNKATSETVISVSANFRDFSLGEVVSAQMVNTDLGNILMSIKSLFGYNFTVNLSNLPKENQTQVAESLQTIKVLNWSFTGTMGDYLNKIRQHFGLEYITEINPDTKEKVVLFTINPIVLNYYIDIGKKYSEGKIYTVNVNPQEKFDLKTDIKALYVNGNEKTAIVLKEGTGLLERPYLDNRNVKIPYNSKINANEAVVEDKGVQVKRDKKTGEVKKDKAGNIKYTKPKPKTINRRFLSAKAQINPAIKPQSMIKIETGAKNVDGLYRARNCKFRGDTHDGEWSVEMELEDTADSREAVPEKGLPSESEDFEVISN